ncbi:MAG: YIP1 family protein [Bacteroidota bacterium]|nr:YIP1 family protein [Bacteroidota bacterium]
MNLIERVKNIITTPKTEWLAIETETATPGSLLVSYVLPMAIIASLGALIKGFLWAGTWGMQYYLVTVCISFISILISFYIASYVFDMLAPSFNSEKNINRSAQLVAYSNTPTWVAGFLSFIPVLGWLILIAGWVYSVYLMYLGVGPLKKTPEDKKVIYIIIAFIVMLVIGFIIAAILGSIFYGMMGYGYGWNRVAY